MKSFSRLLLALGLTMLFVGLMSAQFSVNIYANDNAGNHSILTIGTGTTATSGIDTLLGEVELPPVPPSDIYDVRTVWRTTGQGSLKDLRHFVSNATTDTFQIALNPQGDHFPTAPIVDTVWLRWNKGLKLVGAGYWHLVDVATGGSGGLHSFDIDMTKDTIVAVPEHLSGGVYILQGDTTAYSTFTPDLWVAPKAAPVKREVKTYPWPTPNFFNVGEEIDFHLKATKANEAVVGAVVATKSVLIGKYTDAYKSMYNLKTTSQHSQDSLFCLDYNHHKPGGKKGLAAIAIVKQQKGLVPGVLMSNGFFATIFQTKFNIQASEQGVTTSGLKDLYIHVPAGGTLTTKFNGKKISDLVLAADTAFSCLDTAHTYTGPTYKEMNDLLTAINATFYTGHIDTLPGVGFNFDFSKLKVTVKNGVVTKYSNTALKVGSMKLAGAVALPRVWAGFLSNSATEEASINTRGLVAGELPTNYRLEQNYPNPFNPTTNINFNLGQNGLVTVKIFNILGQEVATVVNNQQMSVGANTVSFDGSNVASGAYFYRIQVNDVHSGKLMFQDVKKMMLVK